MSFADPLSLVVGGDWGTLSLARVSTSGQSSKYRNSTGEFTLTVSHQEGKRKRSVARLDYVASAVSDPYTGLMIDESASIYLVFDRPKAAQAIQNSDLVTYWNALYGILHASSDAALNKLVAGES